MSHQASHQGAHFIGATKTASRAEPGAQGAAAEGSPFGLRRSSEVRDASRFVLERRAPREESLFELRGAGNSDEAGRRGGQELSVLFSSWLVRVSAGQRKHSR